MQPIMQQRMASPKLSAFSPNQPIPTPRRQRPLHKSNSAIKAVPIPVNKKSAAKREYYVNKTDASMFATQESIQSTAKKPLREKASSPSSKFERSLNKSTLNRTAKSVANFSVFKDRYMTDDQVEILSLQAKIKGLEAQLASECDAEKQIDQLKR